MARRRTATRSRSGDYFVIRLLRALMSGAMILAGLGLVLILFWILALGADTADQVPAPLVIVVLLSLAVTSGCHWLIRWARPALR